MATETILYINGWNTPFTLVVEPWADEFMIAPNDRCRIVAIHPKSAAPFGVEFPGCGGERRLVVWVEAGGATYQFWRNDQLEFDTPVAIPG